MGKRITKRSKQFDKALKHIKDKSLKIKIWKQIEKINENPAIGDFLSYDLKGKRKIYIGSFRIIYIYDKKDNIIKFLDFDKRSKIYK